MLSMNRGRPGSSGIRHEATSSPSALNSRAWRWTWSGKAWNSPQSTVTVVRIPFEVRHQSEFDSIRAALMGVRDVLEVIRQGNRKA